MCPSLTREFSGGFSLFGKYISKSGTLVIMILDIIMVIMNDSGSHWVSWIRRRQSVKRIIKILFIVFHGHDKGRWTTQAAKIPKNKGTSWLYIFFIKADEQIPLMW